VKTIESWFAQKGSRLFALSSCSHREFLKSSSIQPTIKHIVLISSKRDVVDALEKEGKTIVAAAAPLSLRFQTLQGSIRAVSLDLAHDCRL
jgi:hypothetical protein